MCNQSANLFKSIKATAANIIKHADKTIPEEIQTHLASNVTRVDSVIGMIGSLLQLAGYLSLREQPESQLQLELVMALLQAIEVSYVESLSAFQASPTCTTCLRYNLSAIPPIARCEQPLRETLTLKMHKSAIEILNKASLQTYSQAKACLA